MEGGGAAAADPSAERWATAGEDAATRACKEAKGGSEVGFPGSRAPFSSPPSETPTATPNTAKCLFPLGVLPFCPRKLLGEVWLLGQKLRGPSKRDVTGPVPHRLSASSPTHRELCRLDVHLHPLSNTPPSLSQLTMTSGLVTDYYNNLTPYSISTRVHSPHSDGNDPFRIQVKSVSHVLKTHLLHISLRSNICSLRGTPSGI